jgi:hypothetical protein
MYTHTHAYICTCTHTYIYVHVWTGVAGSDIHHTLLFRLRLRQRSSRGYGRSLLPLYWVSFASVLGLFRLRLRQRSSRGHGSWLLKNVYTYMRMYIRMYVCIYIHAYVWIHRVYAL